MARNNIVELGKKTRFTSENQPQNRGRKPRQYTLAKNAYALSFEEYKDIVRYLIQCSKKDLVKITESDSAPIWMANIGRALLKDAGKGHYKTLAELTEVIWGRDMAKSLNLNITEEEKAAPRTLTKEEAKEIWEKMNNDY